MSTLSHPFPASECAPQAEAAALEVLGYVGVVGIGTLCFLFGWLTPNGAAVLTVLLLTALIVLAWKRFDEGRHPCFVLLCTLMFFQGGGLLAYCLGAGNDPLQVQIMTPNPFYLARDETGLALLLLPIAAICVYAPCRWNYQRVPPPSSVKVTRYLPYLYLVFFATLPVQLFKNYRYYQFVQEHGGYTFIYVNHAALAASVPFLVRIVPLVTFPAFVAIFAFEHRKKYLVLTTVLYFFSASFILLLGSRVATFSLILALWCVARMKSTKKVRVLRVLGLALVLLMVGDAVNKLRGGEDVGTTFAPVTVLAGQGISFNVTEMAVKYRHLFSPYGTSYLLRELTDAFISNDASNYYRGRALAFDISVLLNPQLFALGFGTGSSWIAEAYVVGGATGVIIASLSIGFVLRLARYLSRSALWLFVVAMVLPDLLVMPRSGLLDWVSALLRSAVAVALLAIGWQFYRLLLSIRRAPTSACAAAVAS